MFNNAQELIPQKTLLDTTFKQVTMMDTKVKTLIGLSLLAAAAPSFAISIKDAPINQVTIYPNGAVVERTLLVKQGQTQVTLDDLPHTIDISRISLSANNNIQIGSITTESHNKEETKHPLQLEIKKLKAQIAEINIEVQAAQLQLEFLKNLSNNTELKGAELNQSQNLRNQAKEALQISLKAEQQKEELNHKIAELNKEYQKERASTQLIIETSAAQDGKIELSYYVPQASWQPYYRAALNTQKKQLLLERKAFVRQQSGEDWSNVKLILSTDNPRANSRNITPSSWYLGIQEVKAEAESKRYAYETTKQASLSAPIASASKAQASFSYNQINTPYATSYQADYKLSIASSGKNTDVNLAKTEYPVELSVRVVPALTTDATLNVTIPELTGIWPQGALKLYRDGNFVNEAILNTQATDYRTLAYGQDTQVVVQNIKHPKSNKDTGVFDKRSQRSTSQSYIIQNKHNQPMDIVLLESVPLSQHDEIKVTTKFSRQPTSTTWQEQPGIYEWKNTLPENSSFTLDIDYSFDYPREAPVYGLP
ncbi:mucoidy inhibitor MuiA family protein [Pseudomonas sp. F1_0610]|uniref:mucoidy inhibitor MuiA family protein n=1 Tax=Pseudomonas sp. F1_0610 TaxID=3114284 RepID=UPI0039C2083B